MFVYFQPQCGFNDILTSVGYVLNYCIQFKRILLLDTVNSIYKINFSDYFIFRHPLIIYDFESIKKILSDHSISIFPSELNGKMEDVLNSKIKFKWTQTGYLIEDTNTQLILPNYKIESNVIIFTSVGGGNAINIFHNYIVLKPVITNFCLENHKKLKSPYLCIQIRNTDYKCDYKKLYDENKELIHSYETIYIATDDVKSIQFFKDNGLNVYNFTTFPEGEYKTLHVHDNINKEKRLLDLFSDIFIITMADKLISVSTGGFINFVRSCHENSQIISQKFKHPTE